MNDDKTTLITRHTTATDTLANTLRELADTRSAVTRTQATVWQQTAHLGITERREEVKQACANLIADIESLHGETEALRAELTNLELRIAHCG